MLLTELNREPGVNPGRARRCNRGQKLPNATACIHAGRRSQRMIRESEDLSEDNAISLSAGNAELLNKTDLHRKEDRVIFVD